MTLELPEPTHIWFLSFSALRGGWPREEVSGRWKALYLWSEVFQLETRQPIYKAFVLHLYHHTGCHREELPLLKEQPSLLSLMPDDHASLPHNARGNLDNMDNLLQLCLLFSPGERHGNPWLEGRSALLETTYFKMEGIFQCKKVKRYYIL